MNRIGRTLLYSTSIVASIVTCHDIAWGKPKSSSLPAIERVFQHIELDRPKEAQRTSKSISRRQDFFDLSRIAIAVATDPENVAAANQTLSDLNFILSNFPYSSVQRDLQPAIGRVQIKKAVLIAKARPHDARSLFEEGFQRLGTKAQFLDKLSKSDLDIYVGLATRSRNELSDAWLARLAAFYPKDAVETATLRKWMSENKIELPTSNGSSEKINQTYRATDSDLDAYATAMTEVLAEHGSKSIDLFERFLDEYPRSAYRHRVKWWLANIFDQKGKTDRARNLREQIVKENPYSLFAILAARSLSKDLEKELRIDRPEPIENRRDAALTPGELVALGRAETLIKQKALRAAAFELRDLRAKESFSSGFLTYLARLQSEVGNIVQSFGAVSELLARADESLQSARGVDLIFPRVRYDEVDSATQVSGLDPILVFSLIKQESGFDRNALSSSGAKGLMQLMPFTAIDTRPSLELRSLSNSKTNIEVGSEYLVSLIKRFDGNWAMALAGYNAGPYAVDRWLKGLRATKEPSIYEFIESIPYKETREYVSSIMRNYWWYSRLLGKPEPELEATFWKKNQSK